MYSEKITGLSDQKMRRPIKHIAKASRVTLIPQRKIRKVQSLSKTLT